MELELAEHAFVAWTPEPCTPVRNMLTAPNDTIESPVNRPTAGVRASRVVIDSLLPPSRESRCRRGCLPTRGSIPSYLNSTPGPALKPALGPAPSSAPGPARARHLALSRARHLALSPTRHCVPRPPASNLPPLREKIHNLNRRQGPLLGMRGWPGANRAGLARSGLADLIWPLTCGFGVVFGVRGPGVVLGVLAWPGFGGAGPNVGPRGGSESGYDRRRGPPGVIMKDSDDG